MLMDLLNKVATTALLGFVVSSMMAMGVSFTVRQIIDALRDVRLVLFALLAVFVVMPLAAIALYKLLALDEPLGVGLLLLGASAGAPFLPKLTELAEGNLPFAVGIIMLLAVGTVGYLPLVLPLLLPGVTVNSAKIAEWLFLLTLLPLAAGLALRGKIRGISRESEARARLGFQRNSCSDGAVARSGEYRQDSPCLRHTRHPRRIAINCTGIRYGLGARGTWC